MALDDCRILTDIQQTFVWELLTAVTTIDLFTESPHCTALIAKLEVVAMNFYRSSSWAADNTCFILYRFTRVSLMPP